MDKLTSDLDLMGPEMNTAKPKSKLSSFIPWMIGGSALAYLIWRIEPKPLLEALAQAELVEYIPSLIVFVYFSFLIDTQNLQALIKHFGHTLTFAESSLIRGASYLINVIDYTLGMGSIVYFLKESRQVPLMRGTAIMIYYNYINQMALFILAAAGFCLLDGSSPWLTRGIQASVLLVSISIILIAILKKSDISFIQKIREAALIKSFIESSWRVYGINTLYRTGYYFSYILFFYIAVRAFGMNILFTVLIAYVPIILLVISIPVSPFGLGTSQAAMLFLFKDYGSQPQILAFSLSYSVSVLLLRAVIGAYYWAMAGRNTLAAGRRERRYESGRSEDGERA